TREVERQAVLGEIAADDVRAEDQGQSKREADAQQAGHDVHDVARAAAAPRDRDRREQERQRGEGQRGEQDEVLLRDLAAGDDQRVSHAAPPFSPEMATKISSSVIGAISAAAARYRSYAMSL